jgi:hypothetical protein
VKDEVRRVRSPLARSAYRTSYPNERKRFGVLNRKE